MNRTRWPECVGMMELAALKCALTHLNPTGKDGFEGLLALALARIASNPMRLAASGHQFGVDGQGEDRLTPVCFEAKMYSSTLKRESIISKIADLGRRKDEAEVLWVLGATVEVPNQIVQDLRSDGAEKGIATLVLDWNDQSIPSLALTLSHAGDDVAEWIASRTKASVTRDKIEQILEHLRTDRVAQERWETLKTEFSAAEVSGRYAVETNKSWLEATFSSQSKARYRLGQPIAPRQSDTPVLSRTGPMERIKKCLDEGTTCIVLGKEGVGKSWVAAEATLEFAGLSLILSAEKFEGKKATEIEELLVKEFAIQTENARTNDVERWKRRLLAWETNPSSDGFLIVVDGINQRSEIQWDRILMTLEGYVEERGGKLLVTTRPQFYERNVQRVFDRKQKVHLADWKAGERDQILRKAGIDPVSLDSTTLKSLLNPRLVGIALSILPRHEPEAWEGLTVEGLLFEHIRRTQTDGFEQQSPEELCLELSDKAGSLLDDLASDAEGGTEPIFEDELRAVKETRFFQPVRGPGGGYTLNEEGLSLALGFALIGRIWSQSQASGTRQFETNVAALIEPVATLDQTSRIVLAALHICAYDTERFDPGLFKALVGTFSELQNLDERAYPQFHAMVRRHPDATLEAVKDKLLEWRSPINEKWLIDSVRQMFASESTRLVVERTISGWLRHINIDARDQQTRYGRMDKKDEERALERQQEIDDAIAAFSAYERKLFESCHISKGDTDSLLGLSLELLARYPLAPWAESLATFSIGAHLDRSIHRASRAFTQLTSFNFCDPVEAGEAFLRAAEPFRSKDISRAGKWALVRMLYATGREDHAKEALVIGDALRKEQGFPDHHFFSRLERVCATDPCDPESERPENVQPSITRFADIDVNSLMTTMGRTSEDMNYEEALCAVSRFGPETAIAKGKELGRSILSRDGVPLRRLAGCGTYLSPLLERTEALELSRRLQEGRGLETLPENNLKVIKFRMAIFALPKLSGDEQLALLTSESLAGYYLLDAIPNFKPPTEQAVLNVLEASKRSGDNCVAFSALSLVAHTYDALSAELETAVLGFLGSENQLVRTAAFEIALCTDNAYLRNTHLAGGWRVRASENFGPKRYENAYGSALLIDAVVQGDAAFEDVLPRISVETWSLAERRIGGSVTDAIIALLDKRLRKSASMAGELVTPPVDVSIAPLDHFVHSFRFVEERIADADNSGRRPIFGVTESDDEFAKRQKRNYEFFDDMERMLAEKDILLVAEQIDFESFWAMLDQQSDIGLEWLDLLDSVPSAQFPWFKDLALVVASGTMAKFETKSLCLLKKAIASDAFIRRICSDGLSLEQRAVWSCPRSPAVEVIWKERLKRCASDEALALEVLAAERFGGEGFIRDFANEMLASVRHVDLALAVTIAGFSNQFAHFKPILNGFDQSVGFVGRAIKVARIAHEKALWAEHWVGEMWSADSPEAFWLNLNLVAKIIDARSDYDARIYYPENTWHAYASLFTSARKDRLKKLKCARAKTLYGHEKPDEVFLP